MISAPLRLSVVTAPAVEPVTLETAKTHLRIDGTDDDAKVSSVIVSARQWVEQYLRRALISQSLKLTRDIWAEEMFLPRPPLRSVTSITYVDGDGVSQTASASIYDVDTASDPGRVLLGYEQEWPDIRAHQNAIAITYMAGYGTARADVPESIREAILLHAEAHYYRDPAEFDVLIMAARSLLAPYRAILL